MDYGKLCPCGGRVGSSVFLWTKISGKRHIKNLKHCTLAQAKKEELKWLTELYNGVIRRPERIQEIFEAYLLKLRAEKKPYLSMATLFLQRMLDRWGNIDSTVLSVAMINEFQTYLREAGLSPAYCDRHIAIGKAAWNYRLPDSPNPFKRVKLYNPDNVLVRFLSADELTRLMKAIGGMDPRACPLYDWVIIGINTGLRERNIMRLHVSEVDFRERTITVRQKGDKRHVIAMNQPVFDVLSARADSIPASGWFFPNPKTGQPFKWLRRSWATAKKRAGITRPFRFHDLRHHFGTKILQATGNLRMAQMLMGHSSPVVTTRYAHLLLDEQRAALDLILPQTDSGIIQDTPTEKETDKLLN